MQHDFDSVAFCGGGGKGAYHIGVWRSLAEHGCLQHVKAVSGTSIGGLNAVLFALGDYENARRMWYRLRETDVYPPNAGDSRGLFSRRGLVRLLRELDLSRLKRSPYSVYITIYNTESRKTEWRRLNDLAEDEAISVLLSTTALPIIFGREELDGKKYLDGGLFEEGAAPVAPLYQNGYRTIALLALNNNYDFGPKADLLKGPNLAVRYPDAGIEPFVPLDSLGGFFSGTGNFSAQAIRDRMIAGYRDTNKVLSDAPGEDVYFVKNDYARINVHIRQKMLKLFKSGKEIEDFINTANFSNLNLVMPTAGGYVFYSDVAELFGWRVQQHKVIGLKGHYRILDPQNNRRAWVLDPDDIVRALDDYEAAREFSQ